MIRGDDFGPILPRASIETIALPLKGLDGNDSAGEGIPLRHRLLRKELQGFPGAVTQIGKKIPVPRSGRGQAPRKYRRRIFGMLKTTCRWGAFLRTWEQSHSPNSTTRF
jgi:hypothetical protein